MKRLVAMACVLTVAGSLVSSGHTTPLRSAGAAAAAAATVVYRVNAGGPAVAATPTWSADTQAAPSQYVNAAATGNTTFAATTAVNTSDPSLPAGTPASLFQDERYDGSASPEMQWNFPVTPGTYEVRLYFAEIWPPSQVVGARVFNVSIEGNQVLSNYDVFADVGANKGVMKSFVVSSDANLNIDFGHVTENPAIKAIEIVSSSGTGSGVGFGKSILSGASSVNPTSLQFGPDGRLYAAQQDGLIKIYTVARGGANNYSVTNTQTITSIQSIPNHNDDGTLNPSVNTRGVTGILVKGTAANPVIYVTSSDPRIGGGDAGTDTGLDTNSSMLSRLTWNGTSWQKLDLVRGLPRSEENHSSNGLQLDAATNTLYIGQGGNTNLGAPSHNFALLPEFALSAAILKVDLTAIGNTTYDLPTLNDDARAGNPDANDPFGGDNGKNQAKLVPGGPVQVYAPGFRNPYDVLITTNGRMYTIDNGGNAGWGDIPVNEGPAGNCTNAVSEPGMTDPDRLFFVTGPGFYGGHPDPTRGNMANTFNSDNQSPVSASDPVQCDYRGPADNGGITNFPTSTNGLAEYTASNFSGAMKGDLLAASFDNTIYRIKLNAAGDALVLKQALFSTVGSSFYGPLDVTAQGDGGQLPGTIWTGDYSNGNIYVFEPNDFGGAITTCTGANSTTLDEDSDGYTNADEIANGTNPCSAADVPPDWDHDHISNLNDPDDDNDGIPDTSDPFAIDSANGTTTNLPVSYSWNNNAPNAGHLMGLGFTGLMTNGSSNYESLFDPSKMTAGGAAGVATVDAVPAGDALGAANTQQYGFQLGFATGWPNTGAYTAHTRVLSPFAGLTPQGNQSMGLFLGTGDQDNYVKIVTSANGGAGGIQFLKEVGGVVTNRPQAAVTLPGPDSVDLYLTVDPATSTVQPSYAVTTGGVTGARINLGAPMSIPSTWVAKPALAAGIISTSSGGPTFPATWDFIEVLPGGGAVDTTAPTVVATTPVSGASGVVASSNVDATFSEGMTASTISGSTFTLVKQGGGAVAAAVSYDAVAKKATLDPSVDLEAGATYVATVKGGSAGVKDVAGNALASDVVWSFTVAVAGGGPVTVAQDAFARTVSGGWGTADVGGAWSFLFGNAANFAVNGSKGTIVAPAGGAQHVAQLGAVSERDLDAQVEVTFPNAAPAGGIWGYLLLRRQGAGAYDRIGVFVDPTNRLWIRGQTDAAVALFADFDTGLVFTPGNSFVLRVQLQGASPTTVRVKAWRVGAAEPAAWSVTTTTGNGPQVAGSLGIRAVNTSGVASTLSFDNLLATRIGP